MTAELFDFDLIGKGAVEATATAFAGFDEAQRARLATELTAYVRKRRDNWWWDAEAAALAVAAVGCLPSAAAAGKILARSSVSVPGHTVRPVLDLAWARGITWLTDLAHRIAERIDREDVNMWAFVAGIVTAEGAPPPTGDAFVRLWLVHMIWADTRWRDRPILEQLRADPFLDHLLPRVFEIDDIGGLLVLHEQHSSGRLGFVRALAQLADEQRLDRATLFDGSLRRLLRGGRAADLRGFLALHDALAPTAAEVARRSGDYLRLLADAPGQVATAAQKLLRDADVVPPDALLDVSPAVLSRPEKGLVRAQLAWLDRSALRHPELAAAFGAVIAVAGDHPAIDVRERAAALAAKHGQAVAAPAVVVVEAGDDLPPPVGPAPAPPPITDPDELAEEVVSLFGGVHASAPALERVLDGAVAVAAADRGRLLMAVKPVLDRQAPWLGDGSWFTQGILLGVLYSVVDPAEHSARLGRWAAILADARRRGSADVPPADSRIPPPQRFLRVRLAEIARHGGRPEGLLAAPTSATGALDPAMLLDRLTALGDRKPPGWDLTQALLRLPAAVDDTLAARAAALGTDAGDRLARWLRAGGLPQPVLSVVHTTRRQRLGVPSSGWVRAEVDARLQVEFTPLWHADDPLGFLDFGTPAMGHGYGDWPLLWPSLLPGYRGLVAAYAMPEIAAAADSDRRHGAAVLPLLAECTGDGGPALPLAVAYGLAARHEADRVATLDTLLMLAAAGDLDAPAVGRHLGTLGAQGMVPVNRAVQPLRDAATAGA
ncbi:DUF6493 family protein, partial [Dactylosporangium fulvum]|uniref:DUF6493 family protein n=1 Tax=Dactylosporangium fulvum TaxID=53359 RepID=UPI0031CF32A2